MATKIAKNDKCRNCGKPLNVSADQYMSGYNFCSEKCIEDYYKQDKQMTNRTPFIYKQNGNNSKRFVRNNKLASLTQKQKNALREIDLIHREFREDVADYKKGKYNITIEELVSEYIDEIVMVAKQLKFNEEQ